MAEERASSVLVPAGRAFAGRLEPPPSKSVTNRYLNLALLAHRPLLLERPLDAADIRAFLAALPTLGLAVEAGASSAVRLSPAAGEGRGLVECGASGTMARFLAATLCTIPGSWRLDGTPRLRQRPLAPLLRALRELGASIRSTDGREALPLEIEGAGLAGGRIEVDARESSQYVSALLMAATRAREPVEVRVRRLVSGPYVELTTRAIETFGGEVKASGDGAYRVAPGLAPPERVAVEGDWSAACYGAAAAAVTGGRVELEGLSAASAQADRRLLDLLARMGVDVDWPTDREVVVSGGGALRAIDVDLADLPDQAPTLAVVAPFAHGTTVLRNLAHLRLKESDRLAAVRCELERCGVPAAIEGDSLVVPGVWAGSTPPTEEVEIETYDDHRIAMSFAVLGLRRAGLRIRRPEVVEKSYPGFWDDLRSCLG